MQAIHEPVLKKAQSLSKHDGMSTLVTIDQRDSTAGLFMQNALNIGDDRRDAAR